MSTPLASTDAQPNFDVVEVDTDGTTGVLPATTEEALEDALPLEEEDLEGDVVIYAATPSTVRNWKRPALLLALVSLLVIAISVGVSNRNSNANKGNVAAVQQQQAKVPPPPKGPKKEAAADGIVEAPKAAPVKPAKPPKKADNLPLITPVGEEAASSIVEAPKAAPVKPAKPPKKQAEQFITPYPTDEGTTAVSTEVTAPPTVYPTDEGTTTVSTEVTAPPTVANRPAGSSVIESPTWRG